MAFFCFTPQKATRAGSSQCLKPATCLGAHQQVTNQEWKQDVDIGTPI